MKRILIGTVALMMTLPAFGDDGDKTTTSKPYVDTQIATKQLKIPAANTAGVGAGDSVITYTNVSGGGVIGERALFTGGEYNASTDADKMITASALNNAFTNLPTTDTTTLECANADCTLWTIVDQTAYGNSKNLFDKDTADANRVYAYFSSTGTQWAWASSGFSVRIPCKPNTTYTARYNGNSTQAVLGFGSTSNDEVPTQQQTFLAVTQGIRQNNPTINTPVTLTTGPNDKWLIVAYNIAEPQHSDMANNLQVEEGSMATSYEPH